MNITLSISADNSREFDYEFKLLANSRGYFSLQDLQRQAQEAAARKAAQPQPTDEQQPSPPTQPAMPESDDIGAATADKPKRGAKPKAEIIPPSKAKAEEPKKELAVEDVAGALRKLSSDHNMPACKTLLAHFSAKKASEVPADKRAEFIEYAGDFFTFLGHHKDRKAEYEAAVAAAEKAKS